MRRDENLLEKFAREPLRVCGEVGYRCFNILNESIKIETVVGAVGSRNYGGARCGVLVASLRSFFFFFCSNIFFI